MGAQLTYDTLPFSQGGGMKALSDRLTAAASMRAAVKAFTAEIAEQAAASAAQRIALHGALHVAKVGVRTCAVTSVDAQVWDIKAGRHRASAAVDSQSGVGTGPRHRRAARTYGE
ncbi:hypothetical protein ACFVUS_26910 [Nocardia sp. NPDC058058]|uniref:hypothetical protein n=1 Tax=Nocardia sp. NPDC058058 TaxID=3346317 RepID=UPI0036DA51AE